MTSWASETESQFDEINEYFPDVAQRASASKIFSVAMLNNENKSSANPLVYPRPTLHNADTLDVAQGLVNQSKKPLVMNMASEFCPGGGWRKGSVAQEESLFYRSTYAQSLDSRYGKCAIRYPLDWDQLVYSPNVLVFQDHDYGILDYADAWKVDFVAVAGLRRPEVTSQGKLTASDARKLKEKIRAVFWLAKQTHHDCVVLGALGCGAFHNPPEHVAEIFREVLGEPCASNLEVHFAIYSRNNDKNFRVFQRILLRADTAQTHK